MQNAIETDWERSATTTALDWAGLGARIARMARARAAADECRSGMRIDSSTIEDTGAMTRRDSRISDRRSETETVR